MDWTGGARKRFGAAKGNSVIQKQKAHFAKARAAMQPTPNSKSFPPDFFAADTRGGSPGTGSRRQHRPVVTKGPTKEPRRRRDVEGAGSGNDAGCWEPLHEDTMLIASRKRLLARQNWLNLDASRPLRLRFPSQSDKDRVGKRRNISKKSSQRAKPAQQRAVTPLFPQRLPQIPRLGHMDFPPDDQIRIRIGTEALASQTHRSQSLHTRESRQFSPISEESMLLDVDDEVPLLAPGGQKQVRPSTSIAVYAGSQITRPIATMHPQLSSRERSTSLGESFQEDYQQQQQIPSLRQRSPSAAVSSSSRRDEELLGDVYQHLESGRPFPDDETASMSQSKAVESAMSCDLHDKHSPAQTDHEIASEEDDEATWRALMHIKPLETSDDSIAALRSSSQHLTASDSSHRPLLADNEEHHGQYGFSLVSTPRGAGTQGTFDHIEPERTSEQLQASPSESLKQITALTDKPQPVPPKYTQDTYVQHEDDDEDALWRQFIVGDEDTPSEDAFEPEGDSTAANKPPASEDTDMLESFPVDAAHPSSSNGATAGETLFVTGNTSPVQHLLSKQKRDFGGNGYGSSFRRPAANPYDSKAEAEKVSAKRPTNIHAPGGARLLSSHRRISRRKTFTMPGKEGPPTAERSVYDLLDSDGGLLI